MSKHKLTESGKAFFARFIYFLFQLVMDTSTDLDFVELPCA